MTECGRNLGGGWRCTLPAGHDSLHADIDAGSAWLENELPVDVRSEVSADGKTLTLTWVGEGDAPVWDPAMGEDPDVFIYEPQRITIRATNRRKR